ncbi:MAG: pilus assembly protein [Elusimicrobiota bacterium]|nr:pilus assembly protein [Elusimicrobiota bacterium]
MFLSKKGGKLKGQSLTEAALIMPLIVFFLFTIIWFAKVMLTWQQIVGASRYGTDLIVYTPFSEKYIRQDIIDYLSNPSNVGRILDKDKLEVNIKIHDIKKIDYSLSVDNLEMFNPVNILNDIKELSPIKPEMSSVEIVYWYEAPFVFKAFGKDKIYIRAYSEVLNGSASAGQAQRQ